MKISIFRSFGRLSVERNFASVLAKGWLTTHSMRSPSNGIDLNSLIGDLREQRQPQVLLRGPLGKVGGFELAPFYRINRSSRWRYADAYVSTKPSRSIMAVPRIDDGKLCAL